MIFVACSGFPVPVSRYWGDFPAVEISDTELGLPGAGTVRRWLRESPKDYGFSLLAPQTVAQSEFTQTDENAALVEEIGKLTSKMKALATVFVAPESFKASKKNKAALREFVAWATPLQSIVLDLPGWKPDHIVSAANDDRVTAAFDPTKDAAPSLSSLAYLRLPGPAGHRSRYDDSTIAEIAKRCREQEPKVDKVFCVFRNIDMHANGTTLLKLLKTGPATPSRKSRR